MKLELLEDLYTQEVACLHEAERQMLRTLPRMAEAVTMPEARQVVEQHILETRKQAQRLEEILSRRSQFQQKKAKGMAGLLSEMKDVLRLEVTDPALKDAALISAAQKAESHEIDGYAMAHNFARLLGLGEDLKLLEQSLNEEKAMEEKLSGMAESLQTEEAEAEETIEFPQRKAA